MTLDATCVHRMGEPWGSCERAGGSQKQKAPLEGGACKGLILLKNLILAEWTGLEPATPGVTGRYSNQLNYHSN